MDEFKPTADAAEPEPQDSEQPESPEPIQDQADTTVSDTVPAEAAEEPPDSEQPGTPEPAQDQADTTVSDTEAADVAANEQIEQILAQTSPDSAETDAIQLRALVEAVIYITEEPATPQQIAAALLRPVDQVRKALAELTEIYDGPEHGIAVREIAGGYKMATKPEHHEAVRAFVKSLKPPLKLSLAALETLAVIAYKQPITAPEIMEIRGVQGAGVLKTLLDRKLIVAAGRKNVIGKPVLYKTTKDFLVQFGLKDLAELPTLKEFEEIRRMSIPEEAPAPPPEPEATEEDKRETAAVES